MQYFRLVSFSLNAFCLTKFSELNDVIHLKNGIS